ncbi:hypothetical protein OA78_0789 [Latilactobacillus curvatus]|nr:hypothetical protein OA78_0789 [Latilactobacillus curvatus]
MNNNTLNVERSKLILEVQRADAWWKSALEINGTTVSLIIE